MSRLRSRVPVALLCGVAGTIVLSAAPAAHAFTCGTCGGVHAASSNLIAGGAAALGGEMLVASPPPPPSSQRFVGAAAPPLNLGSFDINIVAGSGLVANAAAVAAFDRAAAQWEARIADPITVNINANLGTLPSGVLASAGSVALQGDFNFIRNAMANDSAAEPDDAINAFLPTAATFVAAVPSGFGLTGLLTANKANLKALGFAGLDATFGESDATITFSNGFGFDFDNSNGVNGIDFETVAAHEIGHALGFISVVDSVASLVEAGRTANVSPTTMDLYRFADGLAGSDPLTPADFAVNARDLRPGGVPIFDEVIPVGFGPDAEEMLSRGLSGAVGSGFDGRQASHWRDDAFTGRTIGIMDPTLAAGQVIRVMETDFRALDLIGYDILIPEPASLALLGGGGLLLLARRHRRLLA